MAHAEGTISIDRPIKAVFDFILDGTNSPHWRPDVTDIALMPGKPLGVGAVFKQGARGPRRPHRRGLRDRRVPA